MAKYTPLLVALRGQLGATVFERGLRCHAYSPGAHTTDHKWSNAFANLSKQWTMSDAAYKQLCHSKYRHGTPQGGLVRQVPYLVSAAAVGIDGGYNTRDMLCPSVIDALPGECGYEYNLVSGAITARWITNHIQIRIWQISGAWLEDECYVCYLLIDATLGIEGHDEINMIPMLRGVQRVAMPEPEGPGNSYFIEDHRIVEGDIGDRWLYWCGFVYQVEAITGKVYIKLGFRGQLQRPLI